MSDIALSPPLLARTGGWALFRAAATSIGVLVLTTIHHVYGAAIYATPWRLHIVYIAVPMAVAIAVLLYAGWRNPWRRSGRIAGWTGLALAVGFAIILIGVYEGGYNHVVKNILNLVARPTLQAMCEPPICEMPNDFVFEATGVAQFGMAIAAAIAVFRLFRGRA